MRITLILFMVLLGLNGADTKELSPQKSAQEAIEANLKKPEPDPDGRVQTLNKKGAMSPSLDTISQAFVTFAATPGVRVLEIGAGYGLACLEALKLGAKHYAANDMDERHLKILAREVKEINPAYLSNVKLISGEFPTAVQPPSQSYDAILIARVLHFMTPDQIKATLMEAHRTLKPGGRIYAVMLTPYVKGYASFIPEFERRVQAKHPFPGYVDNLFDYADATIIPANALRNTDKPFLFFDTRSARSCFEEAGFIVEKAVEMPLAYKSKIWQLDGRENVGVIARKRG